MLLVKCLLLTSFIPVQGPSDKEVKSKIPTESKADNIGRHSSNVPPVFIVLHVGRITLGLVSGSASGPVKVAHL